MTMPVPAPRPPVAPKDIGGGDDLGDDFELDPEDEPYPGEEDEEEDEEGATFSEEDLFDAPEQDDGIRDVRSTRALKRKAPVLGELEQDDEDDVGGDGAPGGPPGEKKKKKKKPKRPKLDESSSADLASAGPEQLAAWWAGVLLREGAARGLSALELEEAALPEQCFEDTSAFTGPRTVDSLPEFIRERLPKLTTRLAQKPKNPGAPTCVVLCAAALRATELCRVLKESGLRGEKGGEVAKLFAKHFKLQQHVDYLSRTRVGIAVATPGRLHQLLEQGALQLSALSHVLLDESHHDAKERTLCSIPEVRSELVTLARGKLGQRIREGNVQVVVY